MKPVPDDHEVERSCSRRQFVGVLRRLADALEREERFVMTVAGTRFRVAADASFTIEYEREADEEEIELKISWTR